MKKRPFEHGKNARTPKQCTVSQIDENGDNNTRITVRIDSALTARYLLADLKKIFAGERFGLNEVVVAKDKPCLNDYTAREGNYFDE